MNFKDLVGVVVVLGLLGGGYWWYSSNPAPVAQQDKEATYAHSTLGFTFEYPPTYELTEAGPDEEGASHMLLIPKASLPLPENGETPPAITLDIYPKGEYESPLMWIEKSPHSNFVLVSGAVQSADLDGKDAFFYQWSGLYDSETVVFEQKGSFVVVSAGGLSADDPVLRDFRTLLDSMELER